MATYNGASYLPAQLTSIADQGRVPDQLVVADDQSADATTALVRLLGPAASPKFHLIEGRSRLGPVGNLERALRAVEADVVFLCDQDDVWPKDKIATVMRRFEADETVGGVFTDGTVLCRDQAVHGASLWRTAGFSSKDEERWRDDPLGVLLTRNVVTGATLALRTTLLRSFLPLPTAGWHDLSLAVLLAATSKLEALPLPLIWYRLHGTNAAGLATDGRLSRVVDRPAHLENLRAQAAHWTDLRRRLRVLGAPPAVLARIDSKVAHLVFRLGLPAARPLRVAPAAREAARGGYRTYASGSWSFLRDVLGPS